MIDGFYEEQKSELLDLVQHSSQTPGWVSEAPAALTNTLGRVPAQTTESEFLPVGTQATEHYKHFPYDFSVWLVLRNIALGT